MDETAAGLTLDGFVVLPLTVFNHQEDRPWDDEKTMGLLQELWNTKCDISDVVYIINRDGYIGEGTIRDLEHCAETQKPVIFKYGLCEQTKAIILKKSGESLLATLNVIQTILDL